MLGLALAGLLMFAPLAHAGDDDEGKIMSLEYRDTPITQVISNIAKVSGRNIIVGKNVTGNVTLSLSKVNWRAALEMLAKSHGLKLEEKGGIIVITSTLQGAASRFYAVGKPLSGRHYKGIDKTAGKKTADPKAKDFAEFPFVRFDTRRSTRTGKAELLPAGRVVSRNGTVIVDSLVVRRAPPVSKDPRIQEAAARISNLNAALKHLKAANAVNEAERVAKQIAKAQEGLERVRAAVEAQRKALSVSKGRVRLVPGHLTVRTRASEAKIGALHAEVRALRGEVRELTGLVRRLVEQQRR
jgi:type II secretory pathway component GspD/PulD (secretin)